MLENCNRLAATGQMHLRPHLPRGWCNSRSRHVRSRLRHSMQQINVQRTKKVTQASESCYTPLGQQSQTLLWPRYFNFNALVAPILVLILSLSLQDGHMSKAASLYTRSFFLLPKSDKTSTSHPFSTAKFHALVRNYPRSLHNLAQPCGSTNRDVTQESSS